MHCMTGLGGWPAAGGRVSTYLQLGIARVGYFVDGYRLCFQLFRSIALDIMDLFYYYCMVALAMDKTCAAGNWDEM